VATKTEEQRAYQRGYNRGMNRYIDRAQKVVEIARGYQARLTDNDSERMCENCSRWTRGGDSPNADQCKWGVCAADFEWGAEPRMWVDVPPGSPRAIKPQIITQPDFGCRSWLPRGTYIGKHECEPATFMDGRFERVED
jgi:hypothetical protein